MRIALEKTGMRDGTETITSPTTRALFALVRSAELKDRITKLIEIIGDLQECSNLKWLERHGSQYSTRRITCGKSRRSIKGNADLRHGWPICTSNACRCRIPGV